MVNSTTDHLMRDTLSHQVKQDLIDTAHLMADRARDAVRPYFRASDLTATNKDSSGFDPVTEGDRAVERALRQVLAEHRPNDAILGEEYGASAGTSGLTWILDPIDGTRAFLIGAPVWGTLIAVADQAGPFLGIIDQPYTGERWVGGLGQSEMRARHSTRPLATRSPCEMSEALLCSTFPEIGTEADRLAFRQVADRVKLVRYGLDCYGYGLLALGQIDLVIEAGLQAYDIAGPQAVIEAAGGVITTWDGGDPQHGGRILAAANSQIHGEAMALLNS